MVFRVFIDYIGDSLGNIMKQRELLSINKYIVCVMPSGEKVLEMTAAIILGVNFKIQILFISSHVQGILIQDAGFLASAGGNFSSESSLCSATNVDG